jgi:hypothetical protein
LIQIHGVNEPGFESGNKSMTSGRDLPWLQDTEEEAVWDMWDPTYRDVVILDGNNEIYAVFNLTSYSLSNSDNYEALKALLIAAHDAL